MAENKIATTDDYTGAGEGTLEVIESDEQLEAFLSGQEQSSTGDEDDDEDKGGQNLEETGNSFGEGDDEEGTGDEEGGKGGKGDIDDEGDGEGQGAGDSNDFDSSVHYLDERFKLGMNLDQLPEKMDAATEAKIVGDIFARLQNGLGAKINEYEGVQKVLEDEEVKNFIAAKQEGKTMQDFVNQYSQSTAGLPDEALILDELKLTMPNTTEEERKVVLEGYKTAGTVEKTAEIMRNARTEREQAQALKQEEDAKEAEKAAKLQRETEVGEYKQYLGGVETVYGVPLTDEMREQLFVASTQLDENNMTYLDKALQSDQGILMATLGILHLKTLMQANSSTIKNRANKQVVDKLFASPDQLQSNEGADDTNQLSDEDVNAAINQM